MHAVLITGAEITIASCPIVSSKMRPRRRCCYAGITQIRSELMQMSKTLQQNCRDLFPGTESLQRHMQGDVSLPRCGYINALTISFSHHVFKGTGDWMAHRGIQTALFMCHLAPLLYCLSSTVAPISFITGLRRHSSSLPVTDVWRLEIKTLRSAMRGGF